MRHAPSRRTGSAAALVLLVAWTAIAVSCDVAPEASPAATSGADDEPDETTRTVVTSTTTPSGSSTAPPAAPAIASMGVPRAAHTATLLHDGRVLITGGCTAPGCEDTDAGIAAELFDPATDRFSPGPSMVSPRAGHTATLLGDGRVLLTGGHPGERRPPLASTEIFDPASNEFVPRAPMKTSRASHSATLLADGRVLIAGGTTDEGRYVDTAEIHDPSTGEVIRAARMPGPRAAHGAVLLGDGTVLVVGGRVADEKLVATTVRYDPVTDRWSPAGDLRHGRHKHAVVALGDGTVAAVGGSGLDDRDGRLTSIEIWEPATGTWSPAAELKAPRFKVPDAVVVLADGRVLVAGDGTVPEVFDPATREVDTVDSTLGGAYLFATATLLEDGRVLVAGGYDSAIRPTPDAVLLTP